MEFGMLFKLANVMKLIYFVSSNWYSMGKSYLYDFVNNNKDNRLFWLAFKHLQTSSFQTLDTTELYILIPAWSSVKVTVVLDFRNLCTHFLANFAVDLDGIEYAATLSFFLGGLVCKWENFNLGNS